MLAAWASLLVANPATAQNATLPEDKVREEIQAAHARKAARTPTEQKIDSVLLDNLRARAQKGALPQGKTAPSTLDLKAGDKVKVRIRRVLNVISGVGGSAGVHIFEPHYCF
jgi:hypothetical protein